MKQTILKHYRKTLWSRQQPVRRMPDASSTEVAEEYSTTSVESPPSRHSSVGLAGHGVTIG
ncbi:MAG TPA: hypothetical protein PLP18_09335 [Smithellaceae bacterium]|nr:hypothetical protein [Smithellaceae bacterium]